jgi:hypothetical protein
MLKIARILALITGLFFIVSMTAWGQAHVQTATKYLNPASAATITATFGSSSTKSNLIVVSVTYSGNARTVSTITDTKGNVYARIAGPLNWNNDNWRGELWYSYNITGGAGAITVTATLNGTPVTAGGSRFSQIYISEFSGIRSASDPLDVFSASEGGLSGGAAITLVKQVNYANEMVYASAVGSASAINAGLGFTMANGDNDNMVEFRVHGSEGIPEVANFYQNGPGAYYANMATFKTASSPLPVKLRSLDASIQSDGGVHLDWVTETEINNDYFEVQRSTDGVSWETITRVTGAGNSTATKHYTQTDPSPVAPVSYYRLRQVDYNKKAEYSTIQRVEVGTLEKEIHVYPNPSVEWLYIDAPEAYLKNISIVSIAGVEVGSQIPDVVKRDNGVSVNVSSLQPGLYILRTGQDAVKFYKR